MIRLRAGDSSLALAPDNGGAILGWTLGDIPLMQADARGKACFPLVPYANRIAHGRFMWEGRAYQLARNFGDHPHSIHGIGWQRPWVVEVVSETQATLSLVHDGSGDGWPFAFAAEQRLTLSPDALRIDISVTNRHNAVAPLGLGLHPFFPRPSGASLRFRAGAVWLNDPTSLPGRLVKIPPAWDHTHGLEVGAAALDHCFSGWDRVARLDLGAVALTIEASPAFGHLQVYTPLGQAFFCVEPVTHRPDVLNDPSELRGIGVPAGESLAGAMTIRLSFPVPL